MFFKSILYKRQIKLLLKDLDKASDLLSEYTGGYSCQFMSAEEFHKELEIAKFDLKNNNLKSINNLWSWFAPTYSWDDFVGLEGIELGNRIFNRLDKLKK